MTKTLIIESGQKPTEEQLKEVEEAKKSPINFDEDCEELSPAMMKAFKSAVVQRNRKKKAQKYWGKNFIPQYSPNGKRWKSAWFQRFLRNQLLRGEVCRVFIQPPGGAYPAASAGWEGLPVQTQNRRKMVSAL